MTSKKFIALVSILALTAQHVSATGCTGGEAHASRSAQQIETMKNQNRGRREMENRHMAEVDKKIHDVSSTSFDLNGNKEKEELPSSGLGLWGVGNGSNASNSSAFLTKIVQVSSSVGNKVFRP
mmetsp:Transcript_10418/g.15399  ORF Transcript_10418/g.15399 Transcript_10418/m.15399 type:complete len:124 (-) Transcript_10418:187-558(-)